MSLGPSPAITFALPRANAMIWWALTLAVISLAILLRHMFPTNGDVSWLLDVAGRVMAGARPYVDVVEINPPASIGLYIVPVVLARLTGLRPEGVTDALVLLGYGASVSLSGRILRRAGLLPVAAAGPLLAVSTAVLLVLPSFTFAEREHITVLALLPGLASLAARLHGVPPGRGDMVLAALGSAVVVIIKPMFALGFLGPAALLLLARGPAALATTWELWIAAALAAAYGLAVIVLVPAFAQGMLPVALAVYVPRRLPLGRFLWAIPKSLWVYDLLLLVACARTMRVGPIALMLASASVGFEAVVVLQGKGFAYHFYPAASLAILAISAGLLHGWSHPRTTGACPPGESRFPFTLAALFVAVTGAVAFQDFMSRIDPFAYAPGAAAAVQSLGPAPRVLTISDVFDLGQPFVRQVGGVWVGSAPSTWVTSDAEALMAHGAPAETLQPFVAQEKAMYADDIVRNRPDAVLVDGDRWQAWIDGSPQLTAAMGAYHRTVPRAGPVTMWVRNDRAAAQP